MNAEKPKKENSPKKSSPKKSCKEQRQASKMKKKAAKYLVDDNSIIPLDNVLQEEGIVIKKEAYEEQSQAQNDKFLDIGNISLHFNDEENEEKIEEVLVDKNENEKVDMITKLYPKPRMAKPIDFRSEICNGSFYH